MPLGVKERILSIRLMEKLKASPAVAEKLEIVAINEMHNVQEENNMEQAHDA